MYNASLYAALLLGYTIHFIYCIWGNLRITVAELIAAAASQCRLMPLFANASAVSCLAVAIGLRPPLAIVAIATATATGRSTGNSRK